jgi:hypothetical protein
MNRWEVDHAKGHAAVLRPLFERMVMDVDCILNFAEILDDEQIILLNTNLHDLLNDAKRQVLLFTFDRRP